MSTTPNRRIPFVAVLAVGALVVTVTVWIARPSVPASPRSDGPTPTAAATRSESPTEPSEPDPAGTVAALGRALWPQRGVAALEAAQNAAAAGEAAALRQTDRWDGSPPGGRRVAAAFVREVIGWHDGVEAIDGACAAPGRRRLARECTTVWTFARHRHGVHVLVGQPVRAGADGIWAVVGWMPTAVGRYGDAEPYGDLVRDYFGTSWSCPAARWLGHCPYP